MKFGIIGSGMIARQHAICEKPLEVTTARIDTALFLRVADEYPDFGSAVLMAVSRRLDQSVKELDSIRGMLVRAKGFSDL